MANPPGRKICDTILDAIGNTPMVRINRLTRGVIDAEVLVKLETFNPGNSIKDRMAVKMIEDAEREGKLKWEEGCLSIPEVFGWVERSQWVKVRALDRSGEVIEVEGSDLLAVCLQHEIDHLHGKLFLDHLSFLKRRAALAKWEEEKAKYPGLLRILQPGDREQAAAEKPM